jgi:transposase InsO family protein
MVPANSVCRGCGKAHSGDIQGCNFKTHPDFNRKHLEQSFEESSVGQFYSSQGKTSLNPHLKRNKEGTALVPHEETSSASTSKPSYQAKYTPGKGATSRFKSNHRSECDLCLLSKSTKTNSLSNAHFLIGNDRFQVKTLLDTGAESGSYINAKVAAWLTKRGIKSVNRRKIVCSCFGDCKMIDTCMTASLYFEKFVNNSNDEQNKLCLDFWVIDNLPYDVVIGNLDIKANPWLNNLSDNPVTPPPRRTISCTDSTGHTEGSSRHQTLSQPKKVSRNDDSRPSQLDNFLHENIEGQVISPHGVQPKPPVEACRRKHISEILNYEPAANGIPEKWDSLDEYLNAEPLMVVQSEPTVELPTHIMGTTELQKDIKDLLVEYSDIFRTNVSPTPADVPSMNIRVDKAQWNTMKGNMGVSPRVQSHEKNNEIQRQVNKMLDLGVIQRSNANRYSQVLLVPKPNAKWRFCIDYQPLNACCEGDGWNLPNIQQMLQRLGSHRPKLFAVMDLTSGYHQAPINISSRAYTAFITFMGIFEWLRVPMGLKGAASYFQKVLSTVVLLGLVYYVCELYIDDIIVHGQDPVTFLVRLRQVFQRLRKHNITLNPEKCRFGLSSVEYVGHTIDETGLSFSPDKLNEVLAIPPPTYAKELRSFLGLASYFRDHIQNLATIAKPLQDMIVDYEKKRKLVWTPEAEQAFTDVKEAIRRCPKLFFMDDNAPVYLHTDASDYGIGAYIFQIIDGNEHPIAFMSKTLSTEEIKWSTIEKECYAIVFSLRKFEYLLRDKHFTLRTDHANLTYVNDPPSPKVRRWKIAIQEYDFDLEFIDGVSNVVADGFSRLLPISVETLCVLKGLKIPDDKYKILGQVHNTNVGHHGLDRMIHRLRSRGQEWKEMRDHVRKFIDNCPCCQKMNNLRVSIKTHPFHLSTSRPMQVIHMDTLSMGITNDNGDSYLLVLIDACSRWLEMYPIPDLSAEVAAMKLFEHFGRFGIPGQILSDNGSQFQNKLHDELHTLVGVDKLRTTPYSHEENGIVERANKEILRHVRSILFDKGIHKEWHLAIPIVQRILNSQQSSTTGCAPAELVLTNAPNLDQGIYMTPQPHNIDNDTLSAWHSKRIDLQQRVLTSVIKHREELEAEKLSAASTNPTAYAEGSYVLLRYPDEDIIKGHIGKLKLPLKGPMLVVKANRDQYTLQDITTGKNQEVHISRLHPFYYDDTKVDPADIARKDLDEEVVEAIVDNTTHRCKSKMDFRVRWEGYDSSHDLWLPWRDLRDNPKLHKYLYDNGMSKLIPKEHKKQEYH